MSLKIGLGYDVHRLVKGRALILGGVDIPHSAGLEGHSDADVLLHAVCDALLGALGKGDIGEHFPNTDAKYKDAASLDLLSEVYRLVQQEGYSVNNIDVVVLAEEPSIKDHKAEMKSNIAKVLSVNVADINIKATTSEGLGFVGARQGMAAYAVALLSK